MSDFKENLAQFLLNNISGKLVSGNKEFVCRCPFCGDSKNLKSAHFYINLPESNEVPVMYHCKKCNASGVLNRSILRDLGVEVIDGDILSDLIRRQKKLSGNFVRGSNKNRAIYKFDTVYDRISLSPSNEKKLKYINNRLGTNLSYQDCIDSKIVLDLFDLYNNPKNYLKYYTRDSRIVNELADSFIGFLGYNNGVLNMRNLKDKNNYTKYLNKRYVNYNLFPPDNLEGTSKYYIIPNTIDTLDTRPTKIRIAEGPFDILSIFYNLNNGNKDNTIYASIEGKSYVNLIKFLLADLRIINAEIHIYFHNDVSDKEIKFIFEQLQFLDINIYFHWNKFKGEKDYGVPKNRIIDYYEQVIKEE